MNDQKVAIDRYTLRTALVQSGVRMTAGTLSTLWEALGGEPAYISGRVYTDAGDVLWCRLAHPGNGSSLWRDCRTGLTFSESAPKRPLTLCGPVPTRNQVAAAVRDSNDYGNSYEMFEAGQARVIDRIMALVKGETP